MGVCNWILFCCMLLYFNSSLAIILMRKRELVALLSLSSWCLVIVVWLFLVVPLVCLQFVIVFFPDHTHLLLFYGCFGEKQYFYLTGLPTSVRPFVGINIACGM